MARVVVGMSGGVDSSLSAALMRERGHEVVGITMKLWPCAEDDGRAAREDACCSPTETIDARAVAIASGVPHYVVDLEQRFREAVVRDFVAGYAAGETPNPCVRCNESIKFGELWEHARRLGAERVATGHYARVESALDRWALRAAVDRAKDQTYFLFSLTQEQLAHAEFPVGAMAKDEVRAAARARGLSTADKRESQDICFVGPEGVAEFLRRELPDAFHPGTIELEDGTAVGEHQGLAGYTVGQRRGVGVAWSEPLHVLRLDVARNALVVGPRERLLVAEQALRDCTWHLAPPPRDGLRCRVRLRHRGSLVPATIVPREGLGPEGKPNATVRFAEPQPRTSPGQACVAYDEAGEWCLGGGWVG